MTGKQALEHSISASVPLFFIVTMVVPVYAALLDGVYNYFSGKSFFIVPYFMPAMDALVTNSLFGMNGMNGMVSFFAGCYTLLAFLLGCSFIYYYKFR